MVIILVSIYLGSPWLGHKIKNKLYKVSECWSRDILNFDYLEKGLRLVSPSHFVYDFSRKIFLVSYSINWSNFIIWLTMLLIEMAGNMYTVIIGLPVYDVLKVLKLTLAFLSSRFSAWPKRIKYIKNKKSF